jgi:mono/diheme cytochrome c family protein
MPAYASLFDGSPDRPRQEARDLVGYLESLGRARELAGPEGEAHARAACNCPDDEMAQMAFRAEALNANPARPRRAGAAPKLAVSGDVARGQQLYLHNCGSCHGKQGEADGPGAAGLHPKPANLAEHEYTVDHLGFVLWNGLAGTSMPGWRDLSTDDLAAIAQVVRGLHAAPPEPTLPANIVDLGAQVYKANCAQCHGERGGGDGSAVGELRIVPADFRGSRPSLAESLRALRNGVEGTQMAPWTERLSEAELSAVAYYVRGFFEGRP